MDDERANRALNGAAATSDGRESAGRPQRAGGQDAQPAVKTRLAPKRSDRRPPSSSRPPKAMTYALKTHDRLSG
jgi:hypothetical protein